MTARPPCRLFSASLVLLLALAGCNIVAPIAVVFEGPQMTPPEYVLQDRATVVFVDDHNTVIGYNVDSVRRSIADTITSRLLEEKVLARMIRPQDAMLLSASSDRHDNLLSIEDIGRKVGADQVIYLNMHAFTGSVDGVQARPIGVCLVKVIDVQEQRRLTTLPEDAVSIGHPYRHHVN